MRLPPQRVSSNARATHRWYIWRATTGDPLPPTCKGKTISTAASLRRVHSDATAPPPRTPSAGARVSKAAHHLLLEPREARKLAIEAVERTNLGRVAAPQKERLLLAKVVLERLVDDIEQLRGDGAQQPLDEPTLGGAALDGAIPGELQMDVGDGPVNLLLTEDEAVRQPRQLNVRLGEHCEKVQGTLRAVD